MSLQEENAYSITDRLAFPRLIGSEGEKKAIDVLLDELKKAGYSDIHREQFKTSFYTWYLARIGFIPLGLLIILISIFFILIPWISIIFSLITLFYLLKMLKISNAIDIKLSKNENRNFETENLYVKLKSKNARGKVIILGHWDSKSQTMPILVRLIVYIITIIGDLILIALFIIFSIIKVFLSVALPIMSFGLMIISIIVALIGMTNIFNKTENKSPGAKDNATATGIVIELARFFKLNPLDNLDMIFLLTGSEELNLGGAKYFISSHQTEFDKENTYVINLDSVGGYGALNVLTGYGIPKKSLSKELETYSTKASEKLGIELKKMSIPTGAWADHSPFTELGFNATTLGSNGGLKEMHTSKDTMKLVSKEGLKKCLLLCAEVVREINNKYS